MSQKEYVQKRMVEGEIDRKRRREEKKPVKKELIEEERGIPVTTTLETPVFKIELKEAGKIDAGKTRAPNISLKELRPPKLSIRPISTALTKPLKLRVKIPRVEEPASVRVSVYEPLTVQIRPLLHPQIKIRPFQDFSVRPLLKPEQINLAKVKVPLPKFWSPPTLQPKILPSAHIKQPPFLKPKLKLPSQFLEKEVESVVYKLKLMGFHEESIAKYVNEAYGVKITYEDLQRIFRLGKEGKIELIKELPEKICEVIDSDISAGTRKITEPKILEEAAKTAKVELPRVDKEITREPSLLELCFISLGDEKHSIQGVLYASPERPIVVLAEKVESEEYLEALKHILREVYRIRVGGFPIPVVARVTARKVEDAEADKRIYVIDDSKEDFFKWFGVSKDEELERKADPQKFLERISELFSQRFGFLIIYASKERLQQIKCLLALVEEQIPKYCLLKIKRLKPDVKVDIASMAWGFVEPLGVTGETFDKCFLKCENLFWEKLEELVKTPEYSWVRESVEDEEDIEGHESALHYLTKVFIIKYLVEKLGINEDGIKTECELDICGRKCYPDIYVKTRNLVIEIETLYGSSIAPWRRIRRTVEKYEKSGLKVWIVIPNLQMTLYMTGICKLIQEFKERQLPIEFYALNLRKDEIISLDELRKGMRKKFVTKGLERLIM